MQTLSELIAKSSESRLLAYEFAGGFLRLELDLDVPDADVLITIATTSVIAETDLPASTGRRECHLFLEPLNGLLAVENDRYMPPTGFIEMMKLSRKRAHLAFGAKVTATACLFGVASSRRLITCLVTDEKHISFEVREHESPLEG